jgi:predicted nucleotidyltransferase component of viral defense system
MLELEQIQEYFPASISNQSEAMLREYLQCKILKIVFSSRIAHKLIFIGGTALRLIYNTQRFSEDLDFDNKELNLEDWIELGERIKTELRYEGINIDIAKTRRNDTIFHHNLRFLDLLYEYKLSPHKNSVLLIKTDSEDQGIEYAANLVRLNKFDIDCAIKVMPRDVALAQKFRAFFDREMGRDLFDISSIAPTTRPCYKYLEQALGITTPKALKERVIARCEELDIASLVNRAKPFLFKETDISRILYFKDYMMSYEF